MLSHFFPHCFLNSTAYPQTTVCCNGLQDISEQCYSACLSVSSNLQAHNTRSLIGHTYRYTATVSGLERKVISIRLRWQILQCESGLMYHWPGLMRCPKAVLWGPWILFAGLSQFHSNCGLDSSLPFTYSAADAFFSHTQFSVLKIFPPRMQFSILNFFCGYVHIICVPMLFNMSLYFWCTFL